MLKQNFKERGELYEPIYTMIDGISHEIRDVFDEWMDRCYWVTTHEGLYFQK